MHIKFDKQDIIDSICVFVAAQANGGRVEFSQPHMVTDIELKHHPRVGFAAEADLFGTEYNLHEQGIKEAIGLYLSAYYSFAADRLLINLTYDVLTNTFSADIIVER
jgi:hypothetical protein